MSQCKKEQLRKFSLRSWNESAVGRESQTTRHECQITFGDCGWAIRYRRAHFFQCKIRGHHF